MLQLHIYIYIYSIYIYSYNADASKNVSKMHSHAGSTEPEHELRRGDGRKCNSLTREPYTRGDGVTLPESSYCMKILYVHIQCQLLFTIMQSFLLVGYCILLYVVVVVLAAMFIQYS